MHWSRSGLGSTRWNFVSWHGVQKCGRVTLASCVAVVVGAGSGRYGKAVRPRPVGTRVVFGTCTLAPRLPEHIRTTACRNSGRRRAGETSSACSRPGASPLSEAGGRRRRCAIARTSASRGRYGTSIRAGRRWMGIRCSAPCAICRRRRTARMSRCRRSAALRFWPSSPISERAVRCAMRPALRRKARRVRLCKRGWWRPPGTWRCSARTATACSTTGSASMSGRAIAWSLVPAPALPS